MKIFKHKTIDQVKDLIDDPEYVTKHGLHVVLPVVITYSGFASNGYDAWEITYADSVTSKNQNSDCSRLNGFKHIHNLKKLCWFPELKQTIKFVEDKVNPTLQKDGYQTINYYDKQEIALFDEDICGHNLEDYSYLRSMNLRSVNKIQMYNNNVLTVALLQPKIK